MDFTEAVFQILKKLSKDQPCDITSIRGIIGCSTNVADPWPLRAEVE